MKKVLFILFFATLSLGSYAQKGMQGVGLSVDGGFIASIEIEARDNAVPITTLKYQYYIHDNIRLVPSLAMGLNGYHGSFHVNPYIKADVFLTPISKFRVYASAGLGYAYTRAEELICRYEAKYTSSNGYVNTSLDYKYIDAPPHFFSYLLGIGVEWRVAYNWTIQLSGNLAGLAGGSLEYPESYVKDGKTYHLDLDYVPSDAYGARKLGGHLSIGFVYNF